MPCAKRTRADHDSDQRVSKSASSREGGVMLKEFRDFLLRGNIVELAVAFVMGLSVAAGVHSLGDDLIMPVIPIIIREPDFRDPTVTHNQSKVPYGPLITDVIPVVAL